jgi:hypothetical protein
MFNAPAGQGLIGVACREGQQPWVREFFELFKTPWEFYLPEGSYSVVISTSGRPANLKTRLLVEYGANLGHGVEQRIPSAAEDLYLECDSGRRIPLYGPVFPFAPRSAALARLNSTLAPAVIEAQRSPIRVIRAGYDLFEEVEFLISCGQPPQNASIPALDMHISMLREWIVTTGIPFVEIPPAPPGYDFTCCLTHDVDFIRITDHKLDHTLLGFLQRASLGSVWNFMKGETTWRHCAENLKAFASLPAVYLGVCDDFWLQDFDRFLELERETKATFFFIPFKDRSGENVMRPRSARRAAAYDVSKEVELLQRLKAAGNEISVHGIDAWHSAEKGREERARIAEACGEPACGIRMHWLCLDQSSPRALEEAGFHYDSTWGYNETIGYRAGTHQVFKPAGAQRLLELPLHIQDTALFYPGRLASTGNRAWALCETVVQNAASYGGTLTVLWHTRSLSPERQWGEFYVRLLDEIKRRRVWFTTAKEAVNWFQGRRAVSFRRTDVFGELRVALSAPHCEQALPNVAIRIHTGDGTFHDMAWTAEPLTDISDVRRF